MLKHMMKTLFAGILILAGAPAIAGGQGLETAWDPAGYWQGSVTYRGAVLPVRLNIQSGPGGPTATLDIPSLVYAAENIPITPVGAGAYTLTFPFGIGTFELGRDGVTENEAGPSLDLAPGAAPPYSKIEFSFGAFSPRISGTVYLPAGEGPFPAVVLIAGSGRANRSQWSYASWADFYARRGYAALVYDRRGDFTSLPGGELIDFNGHARDLAAAIAKLKTMPGIDPGKIGVAGHSRGTWIAQALAEYVPDLAFMIFISPAISTPGEQEVTAILAAMADDGLGAADLAAARTYLRLYFYVAETGQGWDLLQTAIVAAENSRWFQYVDQPLTLEDLRWWRVNMNFSARTHLQKTTTPVLALWGGADLISPWPAYQGKFKFDLAVAGNKDFSSTVFAGADHRLELSPGVGRDGNWHWFGIAPGVLEGIRDWLDLILAKD